MSDLTFSTLSIGLSDFPDAPPGVLEFEQAFPFSCLFTRLSQALMGINTELKSAGEDSCLS